MKLGKDEIQKIFLSVLLLIGLLYCYFTMLLGPLSKQETTAKSTIDGLAPKIASAKATIRDVGAREKDAPVVAQTVQQINSLIPDGAPIAWLPPTAGEFVRKRGIDKCKIQVSGEVADKDITGYKKVLWTIDFVQVEATQLGKLIADLENERPLWEITGMQITATKENPQYQTAHLALSAIVKQ